MKEEILHVIFFQWVLHLHVIKFSESHFVTQSFSSSDGIKQSTRTS